MKGAPAAAGPGGGRALNAFGPDHIGRTLMLLGGLIFAAGLLVTLLGRVPGLGRLPGDIVVQRGNFTFYFPLATSILLSLLLTLCFWIFRSR